jgi:azurin
MQAPDLWYVPIGKDGRPGKKERVLMGLDSADSHHTTNALNSDPAGAVYPSDGVFHRTQVETANGPLRHSDAIAWRFEPRTMKMEKYAPYGLVNPHGKVWDYWGDDILTNATENGNYFGPAISGHLDNGDHPKIKDFWNRPSRPCPGTWMLTSRHFPDDWQGNFLNCNVIGDQCIYRVKMSQDGSGLKGETTEKLVYADPADLPQFRPICVDVGPDGAIYFCDWTQTIIGHLQHHLRDPNRGHQYGRIYRITYNGRPLLKPVKIDGQPIPALLDVLKEPENDTRTLAKIELGKRDSAEVVAAVKKWVAALDKSDPAYEHHRMEALWLCQWHNVVDLDLLKQVLASPEPRARAAATRTLCYQRDRVPEVLALLKTAAADPDPRVRLHAVRAASFFRQWEAADVALTSLKHPSDYYLDYTLKETMRQLEPWWKNAITEGKPLASDNPAGINYVLGTVNSADLARLPKSPVVFTAMLTRPDIAQPQRLDALGELAKAKNSAQLATLLGVLEPLGAKGGKAAEDLCRIALLQSATDLKASRDALQKLATGGYADFIRQTAQAATIVADGSVENQWNAALKTPAALTDFLNALVLVPDPALRATAYEKVQPMLTALPPAMDAALKNSKNANGRFVRIELPRKGTLTLAEVQVFADGRNIAGAGTAKQSSTSNGGDAQRAVDGNTDGSYSSGTETHTNENEDHPWWELDLKTAQPISAIAIWNRTENNGGYVSRLEGFTLTVLDTDRREVFKKAGNPAPKESARIELQGDPAGAIRRAAIRAIAGLGKEPQAVFASLVDLIKKGDQTTAAAQAIMQLPRSAWMKEQAAPAVSALVAWAGKVSADARTAQDYIETVQVATELAALLPAADAATARAALKELRVNVFVIKTLREQMRYDTPRLVVEAGKPFEVILENADAMGHNFVIVKPGTKEKVGTASATMTPDKLDAQGRAYLPNSSDILAATKLVEPGQKETLKFTAPVESGEYEYVCTVPGHFAIMNGKLIVTKDVDAYLAANPTVAAN